MGNHAQPSEQTGDHTPITHAVVFVGGYAPHTRAFDAILDHSLIIAADSGWEHAVASGRTPHVLIGDMDSISPAHLAHAHAADTEVIAHSPLKDHTDTELALLEAARRGATEITLIAGGGDRPDHVVAMLHSLADPALAHVTVNGHLGGTQFVVVHATATNTNPTPLPAHPGDTVSLVPLGGDATVTALGLQWPLDRSTLRAHASRGVSNVSTGATTLLVHTGVVIAFITPGDTQ
jgi:thiamine pyrophosphokinase